MEFQVIKTQIVELPFTAGDTRTQVNFPTNNFLRLKEIVSIEVYSRADIPTAPISLAQLPTMVQLQTAFMSLYGANPESANAQGIWLENIPLVSLHRVQNDTDPYVRDLYTIIPRIIVWEKSYIRLTAPLGETPATSFVLLVGYKGNDGDN